ncbi:unnamed protein product [Urochloa humidicola]
MFILSLDADATMTDSIELPLDRWLPRRQIEELAVLGATEQGTRLSVVLAEDERISMWTLSQRRVQRPWSKQVWISRTAIEKQLTADLGEYRWSVRFEAFGGKSGTVLFRMPGVGLVRLDLGTEAATLLCRCSYIDTCWACLQEIDLANLFRSMKRF